MNLKILIADDSAEMRRRIRSILAERREWKICGEVSTGAETVEMARSLRPNMLLLDLTLPDIDAEEVIPEIISVLPAARIVVLATHDAGKLAVKALRAGASGLAMKTGPAKDLLLTVDSIAKNQPFLSLAAHRCIKKHIQKEVEKEIQRLIQDRDDIDTAIAEFERLEARSIAKAAKSESVIQIKRKRGPRKSRKTP